MDSLGNGSKLWNAINCQQNPLDANTLNIIFSLHPIYIGAIQGVYNTRAG